MYTTDIDTDRQLYYNALTNNVHDDRLYMTTDGHTDDYDIQFTYRRQSRETYPEYDQYLYETEDDDSMYADTIELE